MIRFALIPITVVLGFVSTLAFVSSAAAAPRTKSAPAKKIETETKELDAAGLKSVEVKNINGLVKISGKPVSKAVIVANKVLFAKTCQLLIDRVGDKLVVHVKQAGFVNSDDCQVDLELKVPRSVSLDLTLGTGDIELRGTDGPLKFKMGSGRVTANGHFPTIDGESASGSLRLTGLAGGGTLESGNANYDITFARVLLKGELEFSLAAGNAYLQVPKGTKLQTKLTSASGKVTNEVGESPSSDFKVTMKAASGNLNIKTY